MRELLERVAAGQHEHDDGAGEILVQQRDATIDTPAR